MTKVLRLADVPVDELDALFCELGLELQRVADGAPIPGSYWGEPEAGLRAGCVYARNDTPLHSLLHESCHLLLAEPARRALVDTDAADSIADENAVCYLQILLADRIQGFGRERAYRDMDAWGYSFRLGSAQAWFEHDAEDAIAHLHSRPWLQGLLRSLHRVTAEAGRSGHAH